MQWKRLEWANNRQRVPGHVALGKQTTRWMSVCVVDIHFKSKSILKSNYLIQEVKQLADVIGDGRSVWISPLEMLLIDFANTFHTFVDTFIVRICACFGPCAWLYQQNCVRHVSFLCFAALCLLPPLNVFVRLKTFLDFSNFVHNQNAVRVCVMYETGVKISFHRIGYDEITGKTQKRKLPNWSNTTKQCQKCKTKVILLFENDIECVACVCRAMCVYRMQREMEWNMFDISPRKLFTASRCRCMYGAHIQHVAHIANLCFIGKRLPPSYSAHFNPLWKTWQNIIENSNFIYYAANVLQIK